jgi:hypothetical protein
MAKTTNRLTKFKIAKLIENGKKGHKSKTHDGNGLYLNVTNTGTASWLYKYWDRTQRRKREMGLDSYSAVTLGEARELPLNKRKLRQQDKDPITERKIARVTSETIPFFRVVFKEWIDDRAPEWRGGKRGKNRKDNVQQRFDLHADAALGGLPGDRITGHIAYDMLKPNWDSLQPTGSYLRSECERAWDYGKVKYWPKQQIQNPFAWRGNLSALLASPNKLRKKLHGTVGHKHLPHQEVPAFMAKLMRRAEEHNDVVSYCLAFQILTMGRP